MIHLMQNQFILKIQISNFQNVNFSYEINEGKTLNSINLNLRVEK